jgi:hypothetical protein
MTKTTQVAPDVEEIKRQVRHETIEKVLRVCTRVKDYFGCSSMASRICGAISEGVRQIETDG